MNENPLTKSQLSSSLAEKAGITKATAKTVIDAIASIDLQSPESANWLLAVVAPEWEEIPLPVKQSAYRPERY